MSHYIHDLPGRLRFRNRLFKNADTQGFIKNLFSRQPGIQSVDFNITTGSVVIRYNPSLTSSMEILNVFQTAGYLDRSRIVTNDQYIHRTVSNAGNLISKAVLGTFVEKALEGSALSLIALLI